MTLNHETLLRAYPGTPRQVNDRIDHTLAAIHREAATQKPPKRYAVRLRFATALAALLVLLATLGIAAGIRYGVFDFMARLLGQADVLPQASQLVQNDLATLETEHAAITLTQAVYDGGNLRVVYSVRWKAATVPVTQADLNDEHSALRKAIAADGISLWGCDWFYVDGTEYTMTSGSTLDTMPGTENGEVLCYLDISLASSGIVPQGDFQIRLPIVRRGRGDITTLDFTVQLTAQATALPSMQAKGARVTVLSASLSPVRAYVNLLIEKDEATSERDFTLLLADWQDAVLVDGQGKELTELSEFQLSAQEEGQSAEYSFTFLPTDAAEAYLAPVIIDENDQWVVDNSQSIRVK